VQALGAGRQAGKRASGGEREEGGGGLQAAGIAAAVVYCALLRVRPNTLKKHSAHSEPRAGVYHSQIMKDKTQHRKQTSFIPRCCDGRWPCCQGWH
jgi:hypothetical protein